MESFEAAIVFSSMNATSERSFYALRYLKTYLSTIMTQEQLNNLMVLYVHKEHLDGLQLETVAEHFVYGRDGAKGIDSFF